MKGFNENEIDLLIAEAEKSQTSGESLTDVFERLSVKFNRAKGSVRNYYYQLMKSTDKKIREKLDKAKLRVEKNVAFSKEDEKRLVSKVLAEVKKGKSVRKSIIDISEGDSKKELRIQNKFRNLLKNNPDLIEDMAKEMQVEKRVCRKNKKQNDNMASLISRVTVEIDGLVEKIKDKYKIENEVLKKENEVLRKKIDNLYKNFGVTPLRRYMLQRNGLDKKTL